MSETAAAAAERVADAAAPAAARPRAPDPVALSLSDCFAVQSQMRDRLRAAFKGGPIALIDIGSAKIACLIASIDPRRAGEADAIEVVGAGVTRARGVELGAITDMAAAEAAIRAAVNQAERAAGRPVFRALATVTGAYPRSHELYAEAPIAGARVEAKDLGRVIAACRGPREGAGRECLHALAVNWSIDGEPGYRDPRGFAGRALGVDVHLLTVADSALKNLSHCMARAEIELAGLVSTPFSSGLACATADELEDGVACVDLGGGVTSLAMFLRGDLVFADLVRAGGAHVTLDVARRLSLTVAEAERLKTLEGSASALDAGSESEVELTREARRLRGGEPITRAELCAVVRPRVEDTLRLARDRLAQAGFFHLPTRRVVLTGGGAELGGLLDAAREVFGPHVRLGRPIHLRGLPAECAGPAYAAAAGLAQYALNADQEVWDQVKMPKAAARGGLGGFWRWLKDAW